MSNPTRDELNQAAEHCMAEGLCGECLIWNTHGLKSFHECAAYAFRALLSAFEREEKMLAVVQEAIDGRPPREWIQRMADLYAEAKLSAIKAIEEGGE